MKNGFLKRYYLIIIGVIIGCIGGYMYYYFIGCGSGKCPITSNPYVSTIWGGMIGGLLFDMFRKKEKKDEQK